MVADMLVILRDVQDPRDFTARHDLGEMLFLALCGLLCGEKTCVDIADFASAHEAEFREVLSLRHGTPSHDTLSQTLRLLDPQALERALRACLCAMGHRLRAGGVLSVDGKALRRAYEAGQSHMPPVMVSVFDGLTRLSLAQSRAGAGGEAEAARALLGSLVVKGCTVTADALHCRPDTATVIRKGGADYVLGLKTNQPKLYAAAEAAFARAKAVPSHTVQDEGHGRVVRRMAHVMAAPADAKTLLPGLSAFGRIVSVRQVAGGREEVHTRYFVLSRRLTPGRFAMLVRAHWGIENHLHWTLDVIFHEDDARSRKNYAPENLALLRRLARNIMEAHPSDLPIRKKMKHASWSKDYLFNVFTHVR
ncbi:ISAs1 family transposase ISRpa5 [Methylobacterium trifolii]|uniref:ISAs1 family transposase ISRpa5 n=2 Tax=Methylobacterium trifolii TaxID=1003092 RepID=A0ABQ4U1Z8_9HYPH|nr:ISAs1 family transposase ISRpa5 [Methylobacterium trifolii]